LIWRKADHTGVIIIQLFSGGFRMRASKRFTSGSIILVIWLVCYVTWVLLLPDKWVVTIREFLLRNQLELEIYKTLGIPIDSVAGVSLLEGIVIFSLILIATFTIGFLFGVRWLRLRVLRDLFS
jgi:uncharacterized membrane protein